MKLKRVAANFVPKLKSILRLRSLQNVLQKLAGGVAVIRVGGVTE
jgi:hypothetical protein